MPSARTDAAPYPPTPVGQVALAGRMLQIVDGPSPLNARPPSLNPGAYVVLDAVGASRTEPVMFVSRFGSSVDAVYADPAFRGLTSDGVTGPVAVGRWLFSHGLLLDHSADLSRSGLAWAQSVGGDVPSAADRLDARAHSSHDDPEVYGASALAWIRANMQPV